MLLYGGHYSKTFNFPHLIFMEILYEIKYYDYPDCTDVSVVSSKSSIALKRLTSCLNLGKHIIRLISYSQ